MDSKKSLKDKISNYLGIVVALATVIVSAIGSVPKESEWYVWVGAALFAVFAWFTGKKGDLSGSH